MKENRTTEDLIRQLLEQHEFLKRSNASYDQGKIYEAKRIAACIRLLLHDTRNSHSIFSQLNIKTTVTFLDTACPCNSANMISSSCLTMMQATKNSANVKPLLAEHKKLPHHNNSNKKFDVWWNQIVLDDKRKTFSRKDLILFVTNKDGGAHVDPSLPVDYYNLTRNNSMGWVLNINGIEQPVSDHCLASIRQIGFEIDSTLDKLRVDLWKI